MKNVAKAIEYCTIHESEPCSPACDAACNSDAHIRRAVFDSPDHGGPICDECASLSLDNGRAYAAQYAYACGYRD